MPELTVTVMSDLPAMYPLIDVTFKDAFCVFALNVYDKATRFDLP
jgi:hypothetical protein